MVSRATLTCLLIGAVALAPGSAASKGTAPVTVTIAIDQMAFTRLEVSAHVGDTVEWQNHDVVDHTSTATYGVWDLTIAAGKKARLVLKTEGTFDYACRFHPNMTGRLIVTPRPK